ncbi:MAG: cytochrome c biosis protein transrane region [Proteobacteria bacterium]|nr:cytochrome c biosis protein transrane region [Pseudomonadota bacterium]
MINRWVGGVLAALLIGWLAAATPVRAESPVPLWTESDPSGQAFVHLYFFWTRTCPHCQEALPFVGELEKKHHWLRVHSHELGKNRESVELYAAMAQQLGQEANSVPAFLFCGGMQTGYDRAETTGRQLEADLIACRDHAQGLSVRSGPKQALSVPGLGEIDLSRHSLPMLTLLIAGLDAFNPCAFFVLLFLMSLLIRGRSRRRMAVIGGLFVFFSGLMYFLFMAAWLNLFLVLGELTVITAVAGLIAIFMGMVNIKDYFFFGQGFSLSIPESVKPRLFQRMRGVVEAGQWPAMIASTVILAVAANSYELLCTAGFPMVYTRILTLSQLSEARYYLYLLLYNLVYVIPLLVIVAVFVWTMGARKLGEREGRLLKLLSGLMMLGLGGLLLFAPGLLNNFMAALWLVVGAVLVTVILAWWQRSPAR